jgi:hypothetical protein
MQFGSLKGVLDEHSGCKPLKDFALLKACREIAQGMEYLVSNGPTGLGYVHRKLSARAVLVDATFTMKISDFSGVIRRDVATTKAHDPNHRTVRHTVPFSFWFCMDTPTYPVTLPVHERLPYLTHTSIRIFRLRARPRGTKQTLASQS